LYNRRFFPAGKAFEKIRYVFKLDKGYEFFFALYFKSPEMLEIL